MIRGQFTINGRTFAVADTKFDELKSNGTFQTWGTVANDALPVTMAASPQQLLLASAGVAYVFNLITNTLTAIPGATFDGPVSQAAICDDFFIVTIKDSKKFYVSGVLDANDWVTNGAAIVSVFPDNIVSMLVFQRQIWFFSDTQSVVYYDSGNIFPFDVNPNAFIEAGCAAISSPQIFNNSIAWLGQDARGAGKVWLASGYTPTRISNHAIEFAIQGYLKTSKISDCVSWTYQDQGHEFYVMQFPSANATWCYDANTGMWHERGHFNQAIGKQEAVLYWNHTFNFGKHLVGAMNANKVYEMHIPILTGTTWTFATDDGDLIVRTRRAAHISKEQKRLYINELQVYVETGLGPQPPFLGAHNPTFAFLADGTGVVWRVSCDDTGLLIVTAGGGGDPQRLFLNDASNTTSWEVKVSNIGVLFTIPATFSPAYPKGYELITTPSGMNIWAIKVNHIGLLQTAFQANFYPSRPPQMDLRVSKDSGHTWNNTATRGCGLSGEYRNRVRWLRLGQARDWVFEIQVSDPIGWRVIDGYINPPQPGAN